MPNVSRKSVVAEEKTSDPKWVQEMHDHFRQNGYFRAEDLQRVLGDPREVVIGQASSEFPVNFAVKSKASG